MIQKKYIDGQELLWFTSFTKSNECHGLECISDLLPQFDHQLINHNKSFSFFRSFKALLGSLLLETKVNLTHAIDSTSVLFWPIQLHHPRFQSIALNKLVSSGMSCYTFYFRNDLREILQKNNMQAEPIRHSRKLIKAWKIPPRLWGMVVFLGRLTMQSVPLSYKIAFMNCLIHLHTVKIAEAAAIQVMKDRPRQYHVVGYDLSIVGRAIIRVAHRYGHRTGRIQNGAVNNRLAGFSEVDDLFLWDRVSKDAYINSGYRGNAIITGNILLQEKYLYAKAKSLMRPLLRLGYKKRALVAFSGPGHNTSQIGHIESLKHLERLVEQLSDTVFIVKFHPKDDRKYYEELNGYTNVLFAEDIFSDEIPDAINFIHACNFVVTGASSVGLDAINLSKPVISIDPLDELTHFTFLNHPMIIRHRKDMDIIELDRLIEQLKFSARNEEVSQNGVDQISSHILHQLHEIK